MPADTVTAAIETTWGTFGAVLTDAGLARLTFPAQTPIPERQPATAPHHPYLEMLNEQLRAYLEGERQTFELPLDLTGTPFQRRVWEAMAGVAYGEVRTYGQLAQAIGSPRAVRAVGAASGANPVPLVLPCHRIIGCKGLTGYAGGIPLKRRLLALEQGYEDIPFTGSRQQQVSSSNNSSAK